ncbi:hypothetical protein A2U01_0069802, partial [Trifolium medium]|nr:hypothetical protein [Trifolium medium]
MVEEQSLVIIENGNNSSLVGHEVDDEMTEVKDITNDSSEGECIPTTHT